jgi:hypothetical protein
VKKQSPPFHKLFRDPALKANVDYRRVYESDAKDDTRRILDAAVADSKAQGITFDEYLGVEPGHGYGSEILNWYANGPKPPKDRTGLVAMLHPQFHRRGWEGIAETATQMAKELKRWIWIVEAEGSRWYLFMVGDAPGEDTDGEKTWKKHVRSGDQYIAVIDPKGEWRMLGCS